MIDSNWSPGQTLEDREKSDIIKALQFYMGNKTQTALALGVSVKTIYNKLVQWGLEKPSPEMMADEPVLGKKKKSKDG